MSVSIAVKCDGCGDTKELRVSDTGRNRDIQEAVVSSGWAPVFNYRHLCPKCVQRAIDNKRK